MVLDTVIQHICNMANNRQIPYTALTPLREDLLARAEMGLKSRHEAARQQRSEGRCRFVSGSDRADGPRCARMEGDNKIGRHLEASIGAQIASELNVR